MDGDLWRRSRFLTYWVVQAEQLVVLLDLTWPGPPARDPNPRPRRDGSTPTSWGTARRRLAAPGRRSCRRVPPALQKYLRALLLTAVAGLPALVSFLLLVASGAIGASMQRWYHWDTAAVTTWNLALWPVSLRLTVMTVSLLFRYAPRRQQPGLSWLMIGAGLATVLWWLISLLLAAYAAQSGDFGATYGPLTGVMALLLWANLTGIALFVGIAFAAQLEARRVGISGPAVADHDRALMLAAPTSSLRRVHAR